jgi:hypothetical protein
MAKKYVAIPISAVYSRFMPKKSQDLKSFFRKAGIKPCERDLLENYHPKESPEDVGFFCDGRFVNWAQIIGQANDKYWQKEFAIMREESIRKHGLEQVASKP